MAFTLAEIVPWGRSFAEYRAMFALKDSDLERRILGCGDGPASFNACLNQQQGRIISVDPLYRFSGQQIQARIKETFSVVLDQVGKNKEDFVWSSISDVAELGRVRMQAMQVFLDDYCRGRQEGRYQAGELPDLDFPDRFFDLALCSHYLFLYGDHLSTEFHISSVLELCRLAAEVRIFPLVELAGTPSRHLDEVTRVISVRGYVWNIEEVPYEFQCGGNQMLQIHASS